MKKYIFLFVLLCIGGVSIAQQELQVSQYMFNGMLLNPAYAGTHDYFSASLLHRSQWVNLDGAPSTQVFAIDGPIANKRMGVGLVVTNDQIGISSQLDVAANFAYHLPLGPGDLSFCLLLTTPLHETPPINKFIISQITELKHYSYNDMLHRKDRMHQCRDADDLTLSIYGRCCVRNIIL